MVKDNANKILVAMQDIKTRINNILSKVEGASKFSDLESMKLANMNGKEELCFILPLLSDNKVWKFDDLNGKLKLGYYFSSLREYRVLYIYDLSTNTIEDAPSYTTMVNPMHIPEIKENTEYLLKDNFYFVIGKSRRAFLIVKRY